MKAEFKRELELKLSGLPRAEKWLYHMERIMEYYAKALAELDKLDELGYHLVHSNASKKLKLQAARTFGSVVMMLVGPALSRVPRDARAGIIELVLAHLESGKIE